jgi:hypothetical protein
MRGRAEGHSRPIRMTTVSVVNITQKLVQAIRSQFMQPRGFAGWLAGWEMALRPSKQAAQHMGSEPPRRGAH